MRTLNNLLLSGLIAVGLAACTSPSRRSELVNLQGKEPITGDLNEVISDLRRSQSLTTLEVKSAEREDPSRPTSKPREMTVGMVEAYPLTNPLIDKLSEESVADIAYKENWTEKQKKDAVAKRRAQLKGLVGSQSCFALTLSAPDKSTEELKYWYGKVEQNGKRYPLNLKTDSSGTFDSYRRGQKSRLSTTEVYGTLAATRREVIGCSASKIDFAKEFKLVFEPRFKRDVLRAELIWERPKKIIVVE